jgi:predicted acylesterase/phospholipase RssA
VLGVHAPAPPSLLDTSPQPETIATRLAVEQVQASSAIQSLFPAVRVDGRWYFASPHTCAR